MFSNKPIAQALEYQRILFENSCTIIASLQDQGQQWMDWVHEEDNSLLPDSSKQLFAYWADLIKQSSKNCQEYAENSFDRIKDIFAEEEKVVKPAPTPVKSKAAKKSE